MKSARGFTLFEVMIALTLTGLVTLMARRLVQVTIDSVQTVAVARVQAAQTGNASGWLRSTLLSLEVGDSAGNFMGAADRVEFSAWVQQPGGWLERRRIVLENSQGVFSAIGAVRTPIHLHESMRSVAFDYLPEPGARTRWVQEWQSPVSAPLALRVRLNCESMTDTIVLLIRERG